MIIYNVVATSDHYHVLTSRMATVGLKPAKIWAKRDYGFASKEDAREHRKVIRQEMKECNDRGWLETRVRPCHDVTCQVSGPAPKNMEIYS